MRYGKQSSDLTSALGTGQRSDDVWLGILAIRIAGVLAEDVYEPWLLDTAGLDLAGLPDRASRWHEDDGRSYLLIDPGPGGAYLGVYPKGKGLFVVVGNGVPIEDVLAELP